LDATWSRTGSSNEWNAAVDLANRVAAGADLPRLASPVLVDSGEVLHADPTAEGWWFRGADVTYDAPHAVAFGGPLMSGSSQPLSRQPRTN
jgi:hypothetical protein